MKKIFLLASLALLSAASFAQQSIYKDTVVYGGFPKDESVHALYDTVYNNSSSDFTLTWSKTSDALATGWIPVGVCDAVPSGGNCYAWGDAGLTHSIVIPANSKAVIYVDMKALPSADDGPSYVTIGTNVGNMTFKYIAWPTNTKDFDPSNLVTIYPNPAHNFVNISLKDKRISTVNVVNVIGRRIARFNVENNRDDIRVPLDKVSDGVYLLQFADINGKVLGVRRLTKQ